MNINHSAEYIALWKSQKRAEWEAVRLDEAARAMGAATGSVKLETAEPGAANPVGVMARVTVQTGANGRDDGMTARQLEQERDRRWSLCAELKAELDRVAAALTDDQRKNVTKVLKLWEREERARGQYSE
jgi:hypothetical protein